MNCNQCVKINNAPQCIETGVYSMYWLEGLVFTSLNTLMVAKLRNTATGRTLYEFFETDEFGEGDIEISDLWPLMDHVYEISFLNRTHGFPEHFTITNPDGTTSSGCCIEFKVNMGQTDTNDFFDVSNQGCAQE